MSATATLPRSAGNGAALVVVVTDLLLDFFAMLFVSLKSAPKAASVAVQAEEDIVEAAAPVRNVTLWQLYRLSTTDSVGATIAQKLA